MFLHVIIHIHLFSGQNNKASFEKLIQSVRNREAGKKTVVKRKLILSDEESDFEDKSKAVQVHKVSGQKCTMENPINTTEEEDTVEKGSGLYEPCGSMSPIIEDVSDDDETSDEMLDTNYESDKDEALSPVLGRNIDTNCSRMETEKRYKGELCDNLTPDISVKIVSRSGTKKCIAVAQQSKDVETDDNSETGSKQTISILSQHAQANVGRTHCAQLGAILVQFLLHMVWPILCSAFSTFENTI